MPHVIVKIWPGKSEEQKQALAAAINQNLTEMLGYRDASVSIAIEEIDSADWREKVYLPDIENRPEQLYKKPGYSM
ncbi:tautomerase family protein [Mesobacterium sp. TK19101]|uniref:Tautomerase family protein n=1 Tax=Mesobacterium hydrothermale TaxID=3111907 RepID=A0ABU6HED1_9RHOB|nr:tautomerase family protein [Mesobacterium sp. TK19101]MEC3860472.1 tautomerase family protein [Mesobacterium sp. TK19101]